MIDIMERGNEMQKKMKSHFKQKETSTSRGSEKDCGKGKEKDKKDEVVLVSDNIIMFT